MQESLLVLIANAEEMHSSWFQTADGAQSFFSASIETNYKHRMTHELYISNKFHHVLEDGSWRQSKCSMPNGTAKEKQWM